MPLNIGYSVPELTHHSHSHRAQLDAIQSEFEKSAGSRQKLIDQRTKLSAQLDDLYGERRERNGAYRQAQDDWYAKSQAEREKRAEAQRAERKVRESVC